MKCPKPLCSFAFLLVITLTLANDNKTEPEPGSIRKACSKRGYIEQPPSRVVTTARIEMLRSQMRREITIEGTPLDAYLITSDDDHQSEVAAEHDRRREYISGFSGSNGDAIVTYDRAALWTDGRYHLQADDQLNCDWLLMKHGYPDVPSQVEWLKNNLRNGSRIGADPRLLSNSMWKVHKYDFESSSFQFVEVRNNLVDLIWTEGRPPRSNKTAYIWDIQYAGKPWEAKVEEVRNKLRKLGADSMIITALDEIVWLLNIRGRDIPYNPFVRSYVILTLQEIHLYIDNYKITDELKIHLKTSIGVNPYSVILHDYDQIWTDIPTLSQVWQYVLLPSDWVYSQGVSRAIYMSVPEEKRLSKPSPIIFMKAQKNQKEIEGMENAHVRDSAALIDFLAYLEKQILSGDAWDELRVSRVINEFRYEQELSRGNSFETIAAYGPNGAKPHYETSHSTNIAINTTSTLVLDSGGQYLDGTTDVTRTLHFGEPTDEQRSAYTRVLMGSIDLSSLIFPSDLPISSADIVARTHLWQAGLDYMHGTGHGIGAFLGVHESPISLTYSEKQRAQKFKLGFFFSNEPGYYKEGEFGIRLENILEVINKYPGKKHISGEHYLGFKDVTLVPYEPKLIDYSMLSWAHRRWLNSYNVKVRTLVGAELKKQRKMDSFYWMMEKTKYIPEYGSYNTGKRNNCCIYVTIIAVLISFLMIRN